MYIHFLFKTFLFVCGMLRMSAIDVFSRSINNPATAIEYANKLKRYEEFFEITDCDEYIKKDPD